MSEPAEPKPDEEGLRFEQDMALIEAFWTEFSYRHERYWTTFSQIVLAHTFLISAPFVLFGDYLTIAKAAFPLLAIAFSYLAFRLLQGEAARISGPANLHREKIRKYLTEAETSQYLISRWGPDRFKANEDTVSSLFGKKISAKIWNTNLVQGLFNSRSAADGHLAKAMPVAFFLYSVISSIIVISIVGLSGTTDGDLVRTTPTGVK